MRYKIEFHPNPNFVTVHLNKRLISSTIETFDCPGDTINVWEDNKIVDHLPSPMYVQKIFDINGIEGVTLKQFSVSIGKGSVFGWDQLLKKIIEILNKELFDGDTPEYTEPQKGLTEETVSSLQKMGCDV